MGGSTRRSTTTARQYGFLGDQMTATLENLFAQKFIARTDAKAIQHHDGSWSVHTKNGKRDGERIPWGRDALREHLEGRNTFGHYLLSKESKCKLFAFDIDFRKETGSLPTLPITTEDEVEYKNSFVPVVDLRAAWLDRAHPARDYMKLQLKELSHMLLRGIVEELEIPCAAAYSGAKGVHVFGFTGLMDAVEVREGAQIVLDSIGRFKPIRGENFVEHVDYSNFSIEVFPKQGSLDGKDLGNLMRLPLGKNLKAPKEPTFFMDMTCPMGVLKPMDAETALKIENPWVPF